MTQIATKFVKWDIPELATLQDSKVYKLRVHLNNGGKLNREEKNWITRNVWESIYFKRGIALSGYHFDFSDVLKWYFVNSTEAFTSIMRLTKQRYARYCTAESRIL